MTANTNRALVHDALIYQTDTEFTSALTPLVLEALEQGEKVCAVLSPGSQDLLHQSLNGRTADLHALETLDPARSPARTVAKYYSHIVAALKSGANGVRFISELDFGSTSDERAEWTRYEAVLNVALQAQPVWMTCLYDLRQLPEVVISSAHQTHPNAIVQGQRRNTEFVDPVRSALPIIIPTLFLGQVEPDRELGEVLHLVRNSCAQAGMTADQTVDLSLVVGELTTNAIEHGAPPVVVRAWLGESSLVYEIIDHGLHPVDPWLGFVPPQPFQRRGRGMWLARQLADRVEIETTETGTSARVEVRRPR